MGALRSAIEELAVSDLTHVADDELDDDVREISRAISLLTAQVVTRVAEVAKRQSYLNHGLPNPTRWLALAADLDDSSARGLVAMASAMATAPATATNFVEGDLSLARARPMLASATRHPEAFRRDEQMLLGFAEDLPLVSFRRALRYWSHVVDDTAEVGAAEKRERAYLHVSELLDGMFRLDGMLDPERGEALLTALESATAPPSQADTRPASNRRAEALAMICEQWLRNGTTSGGGAKPHVNVVVDLEILLGRMGKVCDLQHAGSVTPETVRRILCDADVTRVVMNGDSVVLDLGRTTRVPTPAIRNALVVRDGGCRFAGCTRPPVWCDAHHIVHWLAGGRTSLFNLILVCRFHHTMIHDGRARVEDGIVILV